MSSHPVMLTWCVVLVGLSGERRKEIMKNLLLFEESS